MTKHELCLAGLRAVEDLVARGAAVGGICSECEDVIELEYHLEPDEPMSMICGAMVNWPKKSGNGAFPVPGVIVRSPITEFYVAQKNNTMWDGEYGALRKELLAFLINHFEARVGMNR